MTARAPIQLRLAEALALAGFVACFVALRTFDLRALPVFVDEAIHVDWALQMRESRHLLGITDGGRYVPIVLYALVAPLAGDPLVAARMITGLFGLATALGLVELGRLVYTRAAGVVAALLCLVVPFFVLHERMALVDPMLAAFLVLSLVFGVHWARTARVAWALALGLALGCALSTKLYAALLLPLPVVVPLLVVGREGLTAVHRRQLLLVYGAAFVLALPVVLEAGHTTAFVTENLWLFRSGFQAIPGFRESLGRVLRWHVDYLTPAGALLAGLAAVHTLIRGRTRVDVLLLGTWALWCLFFVVAGGRNWFPRYLLPAIPPLMLVTARWSLRAGPLGGAGLVAVVLASSWSFDHLLLTKPAHAPLAEIDRWQYVEGWPAGYGLEQTVALLRARAASEGPIVVLRDSRTGPLIPALDLEVRRQRLPIELVTLNLGWEIPAHAALERLVADPRPVYLAFEQPEPRQLVLDLSGRTASWPIAIFDKPGGRRRIEIHRVKPPGSATLEAAPALPGGLPSEAALRHEPSRDEAADNLLGVVLFLQGRKTEARAAWQASLDAGRRKDRAGLHAGYNLAVIGE